DYEQTKRGHLLNNIQLTIQNKISEPVKKENLAQRSHAWYSSLIAEFMGGIHSKTNVHGLCSRVDYDEEGDWQNAGGNGYGFACSSAKWAEDFRIFDITRQVQE